MDRKNSIYTIVFYVSLLITCVLIAVMLLAPLGLDKKTPEEHVSRSIPQEIHRAALSTTASIEEKTVIFTESELKTILSAVLKETVGFEIDTLMITNDSLTIMSKANKEDIRSRLDASDAKIGNALLVALKVAPETIEIDSDISIKTDEKTHDILLTVTKLTVLGFDVPLSLLPDEVCGAITAFINEKREELGLRDLHVQLKNGRMILSGL